MMISDSKGILTNKQRLTLHLLLGISIQNDVWVIDLLAITSEDVVSIFDINHILSRVEDSLRKLSADEMCSIQSKIDRWAFFEEGWLRHHIPFEEAKKEMDFIKGEVVRMLGDDFGKTYESQVQEILMRSHLSSVEKRIKVLINVRDDLKIKLNDLKS